MRSPSAFGQLHAQSVRARLKADPPKGSIRVQHDFHYVRVFQRGGDERPHSRAQHLDAAIRAKRRLMDALDGTALMTHSAARACPAPPRHPSVSGLGAVPPPRHAPGCDRAAGGDPTVQRTARARLALGAGGVLRGASGTGVLTVRIVADEQRQRFDLDVPVALQALGLPAIGDPAAWRYAASRWSAASATATMPEAAATMDDLDTPFLAASSSSRLPCSGWMNRLRRYWLIASIPSLVEGSQPGRALHGRIKLAGRGSGRSRRRHRAARGRPAGTASSGS